MATFSKCKNKKMELTLIIVFIEYYEKTTRIQ